MSLTSVTNYSMEDVWLEACLLSLASNINADKQLPKCRQALASLGDLVVSPVLINDCHQKAGGVIVPAYHNQVAYVNFLQPTRYHDVLTLTKELEQQSGRTRYAKPQVTLDVDILAVKAMRPNPLDQLADPTTWLGLGANWWASCRRLPLADYDRHGIGQLPSSEQAPFVSLFNLTL